MSATTLDLHHRAGELLPMLHTKDCSHQPVQDGRDPKTWQFDLTMVDARKLLDEHRAVTCTTCDDWSVAPRPRLRDCPTCHELLPATGVCDRCS